MMKKWLILPMLSLLSHTTYAGASPSTARSRTKDDDPYGLTSEALNGELKPVKRLLRKGSSADARDKSGTTALMIAARRNHLGMVQTLLKAGACVNNTNTVGDTALLEAAFWADSDVIEAILRANPDVKATRSDKSTALHGLALRGFLPLVRELLARGADANAIDLARNTPLHLAAMGGYTTTVQELINGKANINAMNSRFQTVLYTAGMHGHQETIIALLKAGADFSPRFNDQIDINILSLASQMGLRMAMQEPAQDPIPVAGPAQITNTKASCPIQGMNTKTMGDNYEGTLKETASDEPVGPNE